MVGANWGLDPEKLLWTYKALVRPVITYACTIWCPRVVTVKSRLNPLKKLENLALLMVTKAFKSTSQNALHILLDILPLELFLEKMSSLNSLKLKNQGHWPHQSIDHSSRKSFLTCQQIIDSTIHTIFKDSKLNISHFDYIIIYKFISMAPSILSLRLYVLKKVTLENSEKLFKTKMIAKVSVS